MGFIEIYVYISRVFVLGFYSILVVILWCMIISSILVVY